MTPSSLNIADLKAKAVAVQTWWDKPINPQSGANEDVAESVQVIEAFMAAANHVAIGELIALLEQMTEALFDATADHSCARDHCECSAGVGVRLAVDAEEVRTTHQG